MHLLVLSAFRHGLALVGTACGVLRLNAPFGAQCFPTPNGMFRTNAQMVSMHLLVLSAFRLDMLITTDKFFVSQCTFWCSVLSDNQWVAGDRLSIGLNAPFGAQCFPTCQPLSP